MKYLKRYEEEGFGAFKNAKKAGEHNKTVVTIQEKYIDKVVKFMDDNDLTIVDIEPPIKCHITGLNFMATGIIYGSKNIYLDDYKTVLIKDNINWPNREGLMLHRSVFQNHEDIKEILEYLESLTLEQIEYYRDIAPEADKFNI